MGALFHFELKYYIKNIGEVIHILSYFMLILVISALGLPSDAPLHGEFSIALLWVALVMGISLSASHQYQRDIESGMIEVYQQLPLTLSSIILGKYFSFLISTILPILLILPIFMMIGGQGVDRWLHMALGIAAGGAAISVIANLVSALTAGLERARAVSALLLLPLTIPIIIFGTHYSRQLALWDPSFLFLLAYTVFLLPILCLAASASMRASH